MSRDLPPSVEDSLDSIRRQLERIADVLEKVVTVEKAAPNNQCYPCFMERCWWNQAECDGGSCACTHVARSARD